MFIECVDLDIELSLDSNLQQSEPSAPWLRIIHVSALIAVVSARSPPFEVRSIQDCDERTEVLLGSNGEADHHRSIAWGAAVATVTVVRIAWVC